MHSAWGVSRRGTFWSLGGFRARSMRISTIPEFVLRVTNRWRALARADSRADLPAVPPRRYGRGSQFTSLLADGAWSCLGGAAGLLCGGEEPGSVWVHSYWSASSALSREAQRAGR